MYQTYGLKPKWNFVSKWNSGGSKEKSHSSKRRNLPPLPNKLHTSKPPTTKTNEYRNSTASTNYRSNLNSKEKPSSIKPSSSDKETVKTRRNWS